MSYKNDFNVFVGGKSGIFKGVKVAKKACVIKNIQSLVTIKDHDEVTMLSWGDEEEKEILIACGVKGSRSIKIYDTESSSFTCSFLCNEGEGSITGISKYNGSILTATTCGEIRLWKFDENSQLVLNAGPNLHRMKHSRIHNNIIATGGQENKLKLFDLEKQTQIFIEKNVPHDWLELRVPIWISDIGFLPNTDQIATVGRYGHIRLYDIKAQRRPVVNFEMKDEALTCLSVSSKEKHILVGSGKGKMNLVDLRKPGKILNTYKGFVGGVTGIVNNPSMPYIVSVSLDRYLRVHHIDTKELLQKIYLTSKLTCLALRSEFSLDTENSSDDSNLLSVNSNTFQNTNNGNKPMDCNTSQEIDSETEYDTLFNQMQVVTNKEDSLSLKKKRKRTKQNGLSTNKNMTDKIVQNNTKKVKKRLKNTKSDHTDIQQSVCGE